MFLQVKYLEVYFSDKTTVTGVNVMYEPVTNREHADHLTTTILANAQIICTQDRF